jgi:hypothetical protein
MSQRGTLGMTDRDDQYATREEEWTKKREWVVDLLKSRPGSAYTQVIRAALSELIKKAVTEKDIGALAFLAGWFVLVSEDITIDRFAIWMDQGRVLSESDASTDRMTVWLSRLRTIPDAAVEETRK